VNAATMFSARMLGVTVAVSCVIVLATGGKSVAQAISSDELKIFGPTGPLYNTVIPETTTGPGSEPSALFALGFPPTVAPGVLPSFFTPGGPGYHYVILSEPAGEPLNPGELPPITVVGPNGPVIVSDLLINGLVNQAGAPPFIALISDNNPDLATYLGAVPAGTPVLTETGALQDLTALIGPTILPGVGPVDVMAQSVPEPSSIILFGFAGMGLIGSIWSRRRRP
jgi:hypothetical protein